MTSFLLTRESVREFKNKGLKVETIEEVKAKVAKIEAEIGSEKDVNFKFLENGEVVYDSLKNIGGYAGVMIESPHYIVLRTGQDDKSKIYGAYYMEKLITELEEFNLGSCWVTLKKAAEYDKTTVFGDDFKDADYLLAIGYEKLRNPFLRETFSDRREIQDIVFKDSFDEKVDLDRLEERGLLDLFYYIRFAPSTKNLQPWRFLIKDNKVILYLEKEVKEKYGVADAGIIMYYYVELAKMINLEKRWTLLDFEEENGLIRIAETNL